MKPLSELEQLSHSELVELVQSLQREISRLESELSKYKEEEKTKKPPATPENSSVPPSQGEKKNQSSVSAKPKHGPKKGHPKWEREWVEKPDEIREFRPKSCSGCAYDLSKEQGEVVDKSQITEIPPVVAKVIEVHQIEVTCPGCGQQERGVPPAGLELNRTFGSRVEATVVYYRQEQHMSYDRTRKAMNDVHGVTLSEGAIDLIMKRTGHLAKDETETFIKEIRQSEVVNSDETGARVLGQNWWQWVFCTATVVLHLLKPSRGSQVITDLFGQEHWVQVWGSDCWSAQLKPTFEHRQICLAHQLRDLQRAIEQNPDCWWAQAMQALFRRTIHLHHQRNDLSPEDWQLQRQRISRICDWLLKRPVSGELAQKLLARFRKHRDHLFVFLEFDGVEPTNNVAERALRPSVIHRKVTNGFRSEWGAQAYAALASVIDTNKLNGINPFLAISNLLPPSPLEQPSE